MANNNNNNKGSQGRFVLPERADQRAAGQDGLADPARDSERGAWTSRSGSQSQSAFGRLRAERDDTESGLADLQEQRRPDWDGGSLQGTDEREWPAVEPERCSSDAELSWVIGADGKARVVKSGIRLLAHGVPQRVAKLRALGNAIDLRPATAFIQAVHESLSQ